MTDTIELSSPRAGTKSERLLNLLRTGTGASLDDMIEATGWKADAVRPPMTGLRKRGFVVYGGH